MLKFSVLLFSKTRCFFSAPHMQECLLTPGRPVPGSCAEGGVCVFVYTRPHAPSHQRLVQYWFQEKPHGQKLTLPCWSGDHWPKSQVILGYKEANMVRRDNRSDVADNAVLLALRLCWCSIPWHKVKVCPAPNEEAPHGRAATVRARPALLSPSCLPELLVPLCWEALVLVTWINFQMQTMAASANSWLSVAQDVPPHSSFPMPLSSAATSKGRGGSAKGALGVGLLCCADLVRLHYCSHITATFSTPKKPKRQVFGDYLLK